MTPVLLFHASAGFEHETKDSEWRSSDGSSLAHGDEDASDQCPAWSGKLGSEKST